MTEAATESDPMTDERSDDARENFEFFSNEYAQALQAFKAIEDQSTTLMLLGVTDDLRGFVDQFIDMASRTKRLAEEKKEPHFAEWFAELIEKAEALRGAIPQR
jgi:hypothetical protein